MNLNTNQTDTAAELYAEVHRSAGMGIESILALMPKVKSEELRADMTSQMNGYGSLRERAENGLTRCEAKAEKESPAKTFAARMGIAAETVLDTSSSHIAELMIRGSGADIISITRAQNKALHGPSRIGTDCDAVTLSNEIIDFENQSIDKMKKYL